MQKQHFLPDWRTENRKRPGRPRIWALASSANIGAWPHASRRSPTVCVAVSALAEPALPV